MIAQDRVSHQGREQQPVLVIDDFAPDPRRFVDDASFLAFARLGEHYPGVRAAVPPALLRPMLDAIAPDALDVFGVEELTVVDAFYSLVTTSPQELTPIQRLPHFDETSPTRLALLHYLSCDENSGTAFYRHRSTGYESVDAGRYASYTAALKEELTREGLPDAAYISGSTSLFEEVARHAGLFNRAILYRSNTLHSAAISPDATFSADPLSGRLTINVFLDGVARDRSAA